MHTKQELATGDVPQSEAGSEVEIQPHRTDLEDTEQLPALADDSGLCVRALRGAPGVYSARYAQLAGGEKSDAANNARLVSALQGETDRRAYYCCVLALVRHADAPEPLIAEGRWHGEMLDAPRGSHGFGYDPYFFLPSLNASAAELEPAVKNASSHRAIALRHLLARLTEEA